MRSDVRRTVGMAGPARVDDEEMRGGVFADIEPVLEVAVLAVGAIVIPIRYPSNIRMLGQAARTWDKWNRAARNVAGSTMT